MALEIGNHPDEVDVYLVPMDNFPEEAAAKMANFMAKDMKLWVKASVRLGDLNTAKLPGTHQLIAEDIIEKSQKIVHKFGDIGSHNYFLILTTRDINQQDGSLRFVFSSHNKAFNASVVSLQRLISYTHDGQAVFDQNAQLRLYNNDETSNW